MRLLFLFLLLQSPAGQEEPPPRPEPEVSAPLLRYKLQLSDESVPYLHVTSEVIYVYVRTWELNRLPVGRLGGRSVRELKLSRVADWTPKPHPPTVTAEEMGSGEIDLLRLRLTVDDMPETYVIHLEDGNQLLVGGDPQADRWKDFEDIMARAGLAEEELSDGTTVRISTEPGVARELFWLLQQGMGVIY